MSEPGESASHALPSSDAELIKAVASGNAAAYATLHERHVAAARILARQVAPDFAEAEEEAPRRIRRAPRQQRALAGGIALLAVVGVTGLTLTLAANTSPPPAAQRPAAIAPASPSAAVPSSAAQPAPIQPVATTTPVQKAAPTPKPAPASPAPSSSPPPTPAPTPSSAPTPSPPPSPPPHHRHHHPPPATA
jgi:outer membrane biosynthesis protein TonB